MTSYGTILIPVPLEQAASVLREVCTAGYATPAGPRFCLAHPDRFVDGNGVFALAGPISAELGVPVLAAFQYDGDRLELEVWRDGVRAHRYDSWPDCDDESAPLRMPSRGSTCTAASARPASSSPPSSSGPNSPPSRPARPSPRPSLG
ncbi:hypothetical protein [Streptomyces mirabilis]|uniref:hypothetical protein n=1 Tax=Streptomyces mirabilis TaxID=68239 RepID=UPI00224CCCC5|nr:hypothetical protein [Streptomyces mirabilis]MCX4430340.1 hypothetical protein [Streptomyces mirabilis]